MSEYKPGDLVDVKCIGIWCPAIIRSIHKDPAWTDRETGKRHGSPTWLNCDWESAEPSERGMWRTFSSPHRIRHRMAANA